LDRYKVAACVFIYMAIVVCAVGGMALVYLPSRHMMEQEIQKSNTALLTMVKTRVDDALERVAVSSLQLALDPLVSKYLIADPVLDLYDLNRIQTKLSVMQAADENMHSVYLYYLGSPYMITSYGVYAADTFHDKEWISKVDQVDQGPLMLPSRKIRFIDKTQESEGLTILRKLPLGRKHCTALLAVNLDRNGFLSQIQSVATGTNTFLLILDDKGNAISYNDCEYTKAYIAHMDDIKLAASQEKAGNLFSIGGMETVVTVDASAVSGCTYIMVQPMTEYYERAQSITNTSLWLTLLVLVLGVFMTVFTAKQLYQPVERLLNSTQTPRRPEDGARYKEFRMLFERFHEIAQSNADLSAKTQKYHPLVCEKITRDLMFGSVKNEELIRERTALVGLNFPENAVHCVVGYHIDHYRDFCGRFSAEDQVLYEFVIKNILSELLGDWFWTGANIPGLDPSESYYLLALPDLPESAEQLFHKCSEACTNIEQYFPFSITVGIGSFKNAIQEIPTSMREAGIAMAYRFTMGYGQAIFYPQAVMQIKAQAHFPVDIEKRLCDHIRTADIARVHESLNELYESHETGMMLQMLGAQSVFTHYINCVMGVLHELGYHLEEITQSVGDMAAKLSGLSEIAEFEACFTGFCDDITTFIAQRHTKTSGHVYKLTLAFIDQHYGRDVTIADLSDKLMYSPTYINRMLKQQCGSTFNDLLCEKRMQTARELLKSSRMPVGDIAKVTGFNSIQSFNRVFKTVVGATPTTYRSGQGQNS
jgi:AraC-like DNA-binding protein